MSISGILTKDLDPSRSHGGRCAWRQAGVCQFCGKTCYAILAFSTFSVPGVRASQKHTKWSGQATVTRVLDHLWPVAFPHRDCFRKPPSSCTFPAHTSEYRHPRDWASHTFEQSVLGFCNKYFTCQMWLRVHWWIIQIYALEKDQKSIDTHYL